MSAYAVETDNKRLSKKTVDYKQLITSGEDVGICTFSDHLYKSFAKTAFALDITSSL
jgi:hypothetical protein